MTNQAPENVLMTPAPDEVVARTGQADALDLVSEQRDAVSIVLFAATLVLFLGAVLFVTVALNPKDAVFGNLPWLYMGVCVLGSLSCGAVWYRRERSGSSS
jgi:hypothetical protein